MEMIVDNQKLKSAILTGLADPEMVSIINSTMDQSRSVSAIIRETSIPHTSVYRKIKWLVDNNLLVVDKVAVSDDGKKYSLFYSAFRALIIRYENSRIVVEANQNIDPVNRLTERFFSLKETLRRKSYFSNKSRPDFYDCPRE